MPGYSYNQPEPKRPCPYCDTLTWADFVDVGVGFEQCGPYHCDAFGAHDNTMKNALMFDRLMGMVMYE